MEFITAAAPYLLFAFGLVLLIKGGDWFVDGACGIAKKFNIPEILIGATVVSIGTTLPEVMVSTTSAIQGLSEIAYGNAVGSVICNTALISALTVAIAPSAVDKKALRLPTLFFFIAEAYYLFCAYVLGEFSRLSGIILLAIFVLYMILNVLEAKKDMASAPAEESDEKQASLIKLIVLLVVGAAFIAIGARLLVDNGQLIAVSLGVPSTVIALTFVALGTSLPELVTAITSLAKGHGSLSLGNIIGANLFNLVLVSGLSIAVKPFSVPQSSVLFGNNSSLVLDLPLMTLVMCLLTLPPLVTGKLKRPYGIILLALYAGFCALQFTVLA